MSNLNVVRSVLSSLVTYDKKQKGATTVLYNVAKTSDKAVFEAMVSQAEQEHKIAKRGALPQVWRNAKSVLLAGYNTPFTLGDGTKTCILYITDSFNGLKDRLNAEKAAIKAKEQADKAKEQADKAEEKAENIGSDEGSVSAYPAALQAFIDAVMNDSEVMAAMTIDHATELYVALKDAVSSQANADEVMALEGEVIRATAH
jgi:hypothetical protein